VFPEVSFNKISKLHYYNKAGIWQKKNLGGRQNGQERNIGKLKWGVGKLIAHSPVVPIVIPFFFSGTETIIPQDPVTKKVNSYIPKPGHKVVVRFGKRIEFSDLIELHEYKYGPLWKYKQSVQMDTESDHSNWISNDNDKILYSKITKRIEEKLAELNEESNIASS
jgi:monolysocardiolipin acyltransferase